MRKFLKILFLLLPLFTQAQGGRADSLRKILHEAKEDSVFFETSIQLYDFYEERNRDSALYYAIQAVAVSGKNNKKLNEAYALTRKAYQEVNMGRFADALHSLLDAFAISENSDNDKYYWVVDPVRQLAQRRLFALCCAHHIFGILMRETLNHEQQKIHFREAKRLALEINNPARALLGSLNLGRICLETGQLDSALIFEKEGENIAVTSGHEKYLSNILAFKGKIYMLMKDSVKGLENLYRCIPSGIKQNNVDGLMRAYTELCRYNLAKNNKDSSLYYANKQLDASRAMGTGSALGQNVGLAYQNLFLAYRLGNRTDSAFKYLELAERTNDSINGLRIKSLAEFQSLTLSEQQRSQNAQTERIDYQNKIRTYFLLSGIAVLLLLAVIFFRNDRQKNRAKRKIEQAYANLKATQQQLVQAEKMASLGELTAGVAHEIQNPLNFVNNFSEISSELLDEMIQEISKGNFEDAKAIANDVKQNLEKINHHGKRADGIVKGMLQHSRTSSGQKESVDLNDLADEYLRLSYHGLRAKDKTFNAKFETSFDDSIGKVNMVPQDIGRVILNLINNAFYAVAEKKKTAGETYEPTVTVSTRKLDKKVEIRVKDNGNGIPSKVVDKIFQPFFTTKPTGEGTGLGLSLSYDIITKGHQGTLTVETEEGAGSEFIIVIPIIS